LTLIDIVNKVMRKLREEQVANLTEEYSQLVASFVADAHKLVCEHHDWSSMATVVLFPLAADKSTYQLCDGAPDLYPGSDHPNQTSLVLMADNEMPQAYLYASHADYLTGTSICQLALADARYTSRLLAERNGRTSRPSAFSVVADAVNDGLTLQLDAVPDQAYFVAVHVHRPEPDIETDDGALVIRAPWRPIYYGAVMFALNERGEELGEPGNVAEMRFKSALDLAKETDLLQQARPNRFEMYRD
jgi:hypothetical protein